MESTMAPSARSSLEEMLESVRRRDERPKEIPPELPVRPTSKARLPSLVRARRSLPVSCNKTSSNSEHPRDANLKQKNLNAVEATSGGVPDYNSKSSIGAKSRSRLKSPDSFAELNARAVNVERRLLGLASRKRSNVSLVELPGVESPYVNTMGMENDRENLDESSHALNSAADLASLPPSPLPVNRSELEPNGGYVLNKVGALEVTRNHAILGIVGMQKHFRGFVARRHFHDLRRAVIYLQSYIRGEETRKEFGLLIERHRAAIAIQRQIRLFIGWRKYRNMVKAIVLLQSVIRGWNTRRQFPTARGLRKSNLQPVKSATKLDKGHDILEDQEKEPMQLQSSVLAELERCVLNAEAALKEKEDENVLLQERIHQYERRWTEYETRMRSMEEKWQKQMMSLQMSLAAAKKRLIADDIGSQAARLESPSNHYYDSEDATSGGSRTPESNGVQWKPPQLSDIVVRDVANSRNAAAALVKEFEQQRRTFEDDASFIVGVKANRLDSGTKSLDELRKLKMRLVTWKKDYKARLRETKATLQKLGHSDGEKARRKWWGKRSIIGM